LRLFPPEATEAVECVLRHFFWPNQPLQYHLILVIAKHVSAPVIGSAGPGTSI
jgi:hypothetical protein